MHRAKRFDIRHNPNVAYTLLKQPDGNPDHVHKLDAVHRLHPIVPFRVLKKPEQKHCHRRRLRGM